MISNSINSTAMHWIFFAAMASPTTQWALAERLAKDEPVVVVGQPVSMWRNRSIPPFQARCKRFSDLSSFWHYRPLHFPQRFTGMGRLLRRINRSHLSMELNRIVPRNQKRIVVYDLPEEYHIIKNLGEDLSVYLCLDDRTLSVSGSPIPGEIDAEKRLLNKADTIVCVSETLAETLRLRMVGGRTTPINVLPNGYDERLFDPENKYPEPPILAGIPRPIMLVAGYISERIDWEGVVAATSMRPDWSWLFVGSAERGMPEKLERLSAQTQRAGSRAAATRLFWRDAVEPKEVPALIAHCDACGVPYRLNAFTKASSPLKAIEYLAMGAPVLSTRVPSLKDYGNVVQFVEEGDGQSYGDALDRLSSDGNKMERISARRAAVKDDTWTLRTIRFREMVLSRPLTRQRTQA
jgi:glycosyltransferase involved in cell wall biosynthesis